MIAALYKVEFSRLIREPRLQWMALLFFLLFVAAFLTTWRNEVRSNHERMHLAAQERQRWISQGDKDPHSAAHYGVWAMKLSSPLAVLDQGIEPYTGQAVWLEAHHRNDMIFRPQQEADPLMRAKLTVTQIIALLGPVAAILLGFAAFAEDREYGTLRMALGNGARPQVLFWARCGVLVSVLFFMLVFPGMVLGGIAILTSPLSSLPVSSDMVWDSVWRLGLWSLLQTLYVLAFLFISLAVSLLNIRTRTALAVLLMGWGLLCIVMPRAVVYVSAQHIPLPSYQEIRAKTEEEAPAYEKADRWEARKKSLLAQWAATSKTTAEQDLPVDIRGAQLDQAERDSHKVFDRVLGQFHTLIQQQDQLFGQLAFLSPTAALQAASPIVTGTNFSQTRHFTDQAEQYRRFMVNRMNQEVMKKPESTPSVSTSFASAGAAKNHAAHTALWKEIPPFVYTPLPLKSLVHEWGVPALWLLGWCSAGLMLALLAVRRLTL